MIGRVIGIERETGMAGKNYCGSVHYKHRAGLLNLPAYLEKVRAVGAGWIQAEDPKTASRSVTWDEVVPCNDACDPANAPDQDDPAVYRWEIMDWVKEVAGQGQDTVIEVSPGGAEQRQLLDPGVQRGHVPAQGRVLGGVVHVRADVVEHFDGTQVDKDGSRVPEVRYFTIVEEAGVCMPLGLACVPFLGGSVEDLLGARQDRTDPRNPQIAVRPARDVGGSRYVLGAVVGVPAKHAYEHLYIEWVKGKSDAALDALDRSYNVRPAAELVKPPGGAAEAARGRSCSAGTTAPWPTPRS